MYILENKIEEVLRFFISQNDFTIIKTNRDVYYNTELLEFNDLLSASFIKLNEEIYLILILKNSKLLINKSLKIIQKFPKNYLFYEAIDNSRKLISINTKFNPDGSIEYNWVVLDILENKIVKDLHLKGNIFGFYYTFQDTIIYSTDNTKVIISAFDYIKNQTLWQFNLTNLGYFVDALSQNEKKVYKVLHIFGIWQEEFIIACSYGLILCLDVNTGKEKRRFQEIPKINSDSFIEGLIPNAESFVLDKEQSKLIGAFHKYYFEIDLITNKISFQDIKDELQNYYIYFINNVKNHPFTETHLYITAKSKQYINDKELQADCLVALNRTTKKIDWIHYFKEAVVSGAPQLAGDRLYQLSKGDLYIFQKQETTIT